MHTDPEPEMWQLKGFLPPNQPIRKLHYTTFLFQPEINLKGKNSFQEAELTSFEFYLPYSIPYLRDVIGFENLSVCL